LTTSTTDPESAPVSGKTDGGVMEWLGPTLPVAFIALFAELGYAVLNNSTLPVYLKDGIGIDPAFIGPIMMPFFMSELLKGPLGVVADNIGRKPLMVLGPAVTVFTPLVFTLIHYHYGTVFLPALIVFGFLRFLDGLGASALWPAMFAYLGDVVKPDKRASAMSVLNVTYMIGLALGFLAGGFVDDTFGPVLSGEANIQQQMSVLEHNIRYHHHAAHFVLRKESDSAAAAASAGPVRHRPADAGFGHIDLAARYFPSFYLTSLLFGLATIFAVVGVGNQRKSNGTRGSPSDPESKGHDGNHEKVTWKSIKETIGTVPGVLLLAFVTFFGIGCIALQVKIFALDEFGITETQFGLLFLWPAIMIGVLAVPLGHLSDKWGQVKSVRLGFFVGALSLWAMILLFKNPHVRELSLVISGGLLGMGFVIAFPAWLAYLTTLSNDSHRGTIIGAASTAQGLGVLLGTLLGGWLYKHASANPAVSHVAPFIACAFFLTCGSIMTFIFLKHTDHSRPSVGE
jgi:DHA1 family multidrug resistance protein-like MFS transporter